jgi:hypothetical protein
MTCEMLTRSSWKRVFHPRALGHRIIASLILHEMVVDPGKVMGIDVLKYKLPGLRMNFTLEL